MRQRITVAIAAIPATCITTGYTEGTRCKDCGKWLTGHEEIAKDSTVHAGPVVEVEAVEATCTAAGTTAGLKCAACGGIISGVENVEALGHDYVAGTPVAPTCTEEGYTVYTCSRCHDSYKADKTAATGHSFGEWTVSRESTCTAAGEEVRVCANCDAKETRVLALKDHTPIVVSGKAPTCTEDGRTDGTKCSVCGTVIDAGEVIPAKGHTDADGDNACDDCGATIKKLSFIDKIKAFFQKIINWFKNLFKK